MWRHVLAFFYGANTMKKTPEKVDLPRQKELRVAWLLDMYDYWHKGFVEQNVEKTAVGLTYTQSGQGLTLNTTALRTVVERYFANVDSFKAKYGFSPDARLNSFKVAGLMMYWVAKIKPIHDSRSERLSAWVNEEFAIAVGIGLAQNIPWDPKKRPEDIALFNHLRTGLQTSCLSPESLVLLLLALATPKP